MCIYIFTQFTNYIYIYTHILNSRTTQSHYRAGFQEILAATASAHIQKNSKVSSLLNVQHKITTALTFLKFYLPP